MVKLVSKLKHPVRVQYGDTVIIIPPNGVLEKIDEKKLGALPKGVYKIVSTVTTKSTKTKSVEKK